MRFFLIVGAVFLLMVAGTLLLWRTENETLPPSQKLAEKPDHQEQPARPYLPTFEMVRLDDNGIALARGRAAPHITLDILANGIVLGRVATANDGSWNYSFTEPLAPGITVITLRSTDVSGRQWRADRFVVVQLPAAGSAPLVILSAPDMPSAILQRPFEADSEGPTLEVVDYDVQGVVVVTGSAIQGAQLHVYLDNSLVGEAIAGGKNEDAADDRSEWQLRLPGNIGPGLYVLRVDQIAAGGSVASRLEVPFERQRPDATRDHIIVRPGDRLWTIVHHSYDRGFKHTIVYDTRVNRRGDPERIYPGQVFTLPQDRS
jgi:hypothetical protein